MSSKNYYNILDVPETSDATEIKSSYRKLAKKYHPDKNQGDKYAEEKFKEINEAYETLSDAGKKATYDRSRAPRMNTDQGFRTAGGSWSGMDFETNAFDFGHAWNRAMKGKNANVMLSLTLEELNSGCIKEVPLYSETLRVTIPKGYTNGSQMIIPNKGLISEYEGGERGDLIIQLRVIKHKDFELKGNDLLYKLRLSFPEMVLGTHVIIPVLGGKVKIKVPAGMECGGKLKLNGKGINGGNLEVEITTFIPRYLSRRERELLEELAKFPNMSELRL
jgi:curved DNA-binding protein